MLSRILYKLVDISFLVKKHTLDIKPVKHAFMHFLKRKSQ